MACRITTERCGPTLLCRPANLKIWNHNQSHVGWNPLKKQKRYILWSRTAVKLFGISAVAVTAFLAVLLVVDSIQALAAFLPRKLVMTTSYDNSGMTGPLVWDQRAAQLIDALPAANTNVAEHSTSAVPIVAPETSARIGVVAPSAIPHDQLDSERFTKLDARISSSSSVLNGSPRLYIEDVVALPDSTDLIFLGNATATDTISSCIYNFEQTALRATPRTTKLLTDGRLVVTCSRPSYDSVATADNNHTISAIKIKDIALEMAGSGGEGALRQLVLSEARNELTEPFKWNSPLVYAVQSTEEDVLLYVKGLFDLQRRKPEDYRQPQNFRCVFDFGTKLVETAVTAGALEVFRCGHPDRPGAVHIPVPTASASLSRARVHLKYKRMRLPSVAYYEAASLGASNSQAALATTTARSLSRSAAGIFPSESSYEGSGGERKVDNDRIEEDPSGSNSEGTQKKHLVCSCTMIWNMGKFLKEWVIFNSHLGVEKFFLYDNNSEDGLESAVRSLEQFNVSVTTWPWVKTQEAGFSHCAVQAQSQCTWILFTDVDEFLFPKRWLGLTPKSSKTALASGATTRVDDNPLKSLIEDTLEVANSPHSKQKKVVEIFTNSNPVLQSPVASPKAAAASRKLGQISFWCRNFGPSGRTTNPVEGVTQGYTCRDEKELRHKSLVHFPAITKSLRNVIHHFVLAPEFRTVMVDPREAVVNHYKFQAWSEFESKYEKRASTSVEDWKEAKKLTSRDREGLGREAVKPSDWETSHCERNDTGLRDYARERFGVSDGREGSGENSKTMVWELEDHAWQYHKY